MSKFHFSILGFGQFTNATTGSQYPTVLQTAFLPILNESIDGHVTTFVTANKGGAGEPGGPFVWMEKGREVLGGIYLGDILMDDKSTKGEFLQVADYTSWIRKTARSM